MSIASIAAVSATNIAATQITRDMAIPIQSTNVAASDGLFNTLLNHLENVNTQLVNTDNAVQQLANGETDNLHQVMISLEQTRLAFDLLLQVRNKVLDAYQEVMRMQV